MGLRGTKSKPSKLKELQGNPGKRAVNKSEPQPEAKIPPCPKHLSAEAKKEWRRISRELYTLKLLTAVDRAALAAYCQCWARWVQAEEELAKETTAMVVSTDKGYEYPNPWIAIANSALKQMKSFLAEFGMTPSSRSKVTVGGELEQDPYQQFLNGERSQVAEEDATERFTGRDMED